jgi:hypothetical protein
MVVGRWISGGFWILNARSASPGARRIGSSARVGSTSVAMSSVASRALPATEFSVRENTTFGIGRQILANSSSASPDMVCSAVSLPHRHFLVQAASAQVRGDVAGLLDVEAHLLRVRRGPADVAIRSRDETVQRHVHRVDHGQHHQVLLSDWTVRSSNIGAMRGAIRDVAEAEEAKESARIEQRERSFRFSHKENGPIHQPTGPPNEPTPKMPLERAADPAFKTRVSHSAWRM